MIRTAVRWTIAAIVVVALWKASGGQPEALLTAAWEGFYGVVDTASDWVLDTGVLDGLLGSRE